MLPPPSVFLRTGCTAHRHKHITACDAYCILIDTLHTFAVLFCHSLSLKLFDNWHKWPQLTNTNVVVCCDHKIWSIPFKYQAQNNKLWTVYHHYRATIHRGEWQRVTCHLVLSKGYLITYQIAFNVNRLNLFHKCASNNFWLFPLPKGRKINFNLKSSSHSICMSQCSILYIIWGNKWLCDRTVGRKGKGKKNIIEVVVCIA